MSKHVRLEYITLKDFKNVRYGTIPMPSIVTKERHSADMVGIYGQNGSGKTAVIEALEFIDKMMTGETLPTYTKDLINIDSKASTIEVSYGLYDEDLENKLDEVHYKVALSNASGEIMIQSEEIDIREKKEDGGFRKIRTLVAYDGETMELKPREAFKKLLKTSRALELDILVALRLCQKNTTSVLFSNDGILPLLENVEDEYAEKLREILGLLHQYAVSSFVVISSREFGVDSDFKLPITYQSRRETESTKLLMLDIGKPDILSREEADDLKHMIEKMNTVLKTIVPHLTLGLYEAGEELTREGVKGVRVELVSYKNGKSIPIRYESEGIIKIISILNVLMSVYNDADMCLVIDEFDASIFEYLLGELVQVFSRGAQGQMIFTSHNLRILEMISKDSVVFSTANPENRYIRLSNIRDTNNLRDVYIRNLLLGGGKENIYEETDAYEIGRALRKAWRQDGKQEEQ